MMVNLLSKQTNSSCLMSQSDLELFFCWVLLVVLNLIPTDTKGNHESKRTKALARQRKKVYCKSVNFCENFIFANSVKRHICDVKTLQLGHDLPISVNNILISPFREGEDFIFTKLCLCEVSRKNKPLAKISEFTVIKKKVTLIALKVMCLY